jgi:hypothetical protein
MAVVMAAAMAAVSAEVAMAVVVMAADIANKLILTATGRCLSGAWPVACRLKRKCRGDIGF